MEPTLPARSRRSRAVVAGIGGAALALGAGAVAVVAGPAAAATPACQVTYTIANQWNVGFSAGISIVNNGAAVSSWKLGFAFAAGQTITQGWSGTFTQSGANVTVADAGYNGALATGGTVSIGFNGTWSGSNPSPTAFTLNGVLCNGTPVSTSASASASASASPSPSPSPSSTGSGGGVAPQLHVSGNKLVNASGATVLLHGANRSGGEFACVQGNGIWNGPMDQASVTAIKSWHINAVRVPLNEACWNSESYVKAAYAGATYQQAIVQYVNLLNSNGIVAIVDLHWTDGVYTGPSSACSVSTATCQKPMPDSAQALPFWTSVANTFKGNNAVVFDLFNEPYPERATGNETTGWQCWRDGGTCSGIGYQVAGMQAMVNAVRGTGAGNVLVLGGLAYSNDLTQWLTYKPTDSKNNLAASWHSYNFNTCSNSSCWDGQIAPITASVPLVPGEIGENDCGGGYINPLMSWLDSHGTGYLAWTWNNWDCSSGPSLVTDWNGTPTAYGSAYKAHLATVG
jgi:endoglucanase